MSPQARGTKAKINYSDYTKLKSLCIAKKPINKMKRQSTEWEKIYANEIMIICLYKKYIKNLYNSTAKKSD